MWNKKLKKRNIEKEKMIKKKNNWKKHKLQRTKIEKIFKKLIKLFKLKMKKL
jgi:hypothetical protein